LISTLGAVSAAVAGTGATAGFLVSVAGGRDFGVADVAVLFGTGLEVAWALA
jgi:hypothetical protein